MNHLIKIALPVATLMLALGMAGCSPDNGKSQLSPEQKQAISERLAPVGKVAIEGQNSGGAQTATAAAGQSSGTAGRTGETIFNSVCMACHATGAAGAPKVGVAADWKPRIAKGKATLYSHALHGFKGMPPRGTCMDCTDDELKGAVDYMVSKSQ